MAIENEKKDEDKKDGDEEKEGGGKKRKRSRSGSSSSSRSNRRDPKERRKAMDSRPTAAKPDARSRNLFGGLMRHLQKAKVGLDTEKTSASMQKMKDAMAKADQKLVMEKVNLQELRKRQFDHKRMEENEKAEGMTKEIEEMELLLLRTRLERHYGHMMHFIRTKSEPTIFYLPAKGNRETDKMLDETRAAIKHKIASLKVQLQPIEREDVPAVEDKKDGAPALEDKKEAAALEDKKDGASDDEEESVPRGAPKTTAEAKEQEKKGDEDKKDDEEKKSGDEGDKEADKPADGDKEDKADDKADEKKDD